MTDESLTYNANLLSILESVKGIGPVSAKNLVAHFDANGLASRMHDESISDIADVDNIGNNKAQMLVRRYHVDYELFHLAFGLDARGFKKPMTKKLYAVWGKNALKVIDSNPYVLLAVMDWNEVDAIERFTEHPFHPCRVVGAIEWCMYQDYEVNHNTCTDTDTLRKAVHELIGCDETTFRCGVKIALKTGAIVSYMGMYQIPATHWYERLVERFLKENEKTNLSEEEINTYLDNNNHKSLNTEQKKAVKNGLQYRISAYYGRGGRGKTYTLKSLAEGATEKLGIKRIVLTAVANKAVKRMQAETQFPAKDCFSLARLIHREDIDDLHDAMIVIDEASMLSLVDAFRLIKKIRHLNTHLVFLGDHHQIPSIHAGRLFYDIVSNNAVPNVELIKSLRHDEKTDDQLTSIVNGEFPVLDNYSKGCGTGLYRNFVKLKNLSNGQHLVDTEAIALYQKLTSDIETRGETLQIISPLRSADYDGSSETLNIMLHKAIWRNDQLTRHDFHVGTPVVWTDNTTVQSGETLTNGSIGYVHEVCKAESDYCLFVAFEQEGLIGLKRSEVKEGLELAYCLSVHRAQGSEWDNVIIVLPKSEKMVDRNMVYTALSRCKKRSIVIYHDHVFVQRKVSDPPAHEKRRSLFLKDAN